MFAGIMVGERVVWYVLPSCAADSIDVHGKACDSLFGLCCRVHGKLKETHASGMDFGDHWRRHLYIGVFMLQVSSVPVIACP